MRIKESGNGNMCSEVNSPIQIMPSTGWNVYYTPLSGESTGYREKVEMWAVVEVVEETHHCGSLIDSKKYPNRVVGMSVCAEGLTIVEDMNNFGCYFRDGENPEEIMGEVG